MNSWISLFGWLWLATAFFLLPETAPAASEEAAVERLELRIAERKLVGGQHTVRVTQGRTVEMVWTSDEAGELHLHGYDIEFEVNPEAPAVIRFTAHATGRFPVTSHGFGGEHGHCAGCTGAAKARMAESGHDTLLYLEVYPD